MNLDCSRYHQGFWLLHHKICEPPDWRPALTDYAIADPGPTGHSVSLAFKQFRSS